MKCWVDCESGPVLQRFGSPRANEWSRCRVCVLHVKCFVANGDMSRTARVPCCAITQNTKQIYIYL